MLSAVEPFAYTFLFPVGILIALIAVSSGISGSNFWAPVYIGWLGFDPHSGFWLALVTMIFGFGSGVLSNVRAGNVPWLLVWQYLRVAGPFALLGGLVAAHSRADVLVLCFSIFVIAFGVFLFFGAKRNASISNTRSAMRWPVVAAAGFIKGLIASGLGKLVLPEMLGRKVITSPSEAVGATVTLVFAVNLLVVGVRLDGNLVAHLRSHAGEMASVIMWVAPAVVIGGSLAPRLTKRLSERALRTYVGLVLVVAGFLMLGKI